MQLCNLSIGEIALSIMLLPLFMIYVKIMWLLFKSN